MATGEPMYRTKLPLLWCFGSSVKLENNPKTTNSRVISDVEFLQMTVRQIVWVFLCSPMSLRRSKQRLDRLIAHTTPHVTKDTNSFVDTTDVWALILTTATQMLFCSMTGIYDTVVNKSGRTSYSKNGNRRRAGLNRRLSRMTCLAFLHGGNFRREAMRAIVINFDGAAILWKLCNPLLFQFFK